MSLVECRRFLSGASAFQNLATASGRPGWRLGLAPYGQQFDAHQLTGHGIFDPYCRACIAYRCRLVPLP